MGRAEQESTARIKRETLVGLLDTMAPTDQQPITARVRISDVQAEAARDLAVTLAEAAQTPLTTDGEVTKIVDVSALLEALKAAEAANVEPPKSVAPKSVAANVERLLADLEAIGAAKRIEDTKSVKVERLLAELEAIAHANPVDAPPSCARDTGETTDSAELPRLFSDVDWDDLLGAAVSAMVTPSLLEPIAPAVATSSVESVTPARAKRRSKAPFAHLAALLPPTPVPPRAQPRAKTNNDGSRAEQKAVQVIADVREKLETAAQLEPMGERSEFSTLSPQVAAELSADEIAMLPMEMRLRLAELTPTPFPRIAITPLPTDIGIAIHSTPSKELGHEIRVSDPVESSPKAIWPVLTLVGYFAAACVAGFGAVYYLA